MPRNAFSLSQDTAAKNPKQDVHRQNSPRSATRSPVRRKRSETRSPVRRKRSESRFPVRRRSEVKPWRPYRGQNDVKLCGNSKQICFAHNPHQRQECKDPQCNRTHLDTWDLGEPAKKGYAKKLTKIIDEDAHHGKADNAQSLGKDGKSSESSEGLQKRRRRRSPSYSPRRRESPSYSPRRKQKKYKKEKKQKKQKEKKKQKKHKAHQKGKSRRRSKVRAASRRSSSSSCKSSKGSCGKSSTGSCEKNPNGSCEIDPTDTVVGVMPFKDFMKSQHTQVTPDDAIAAYGAYTEAQAMRRTHRDLKKHEDSIRRERAAAAFHRHEAHSDSCFNTIVFKSLSPDVSRLTILAHARPLLYRCVAEYLDIDSLSQVDCTDRILRDLNCGTSGPWHTTGRQKYWCLELDEQGTFEPATACVGNWKRRVFNFKVAVRSFRGQQVSVEEHAWWLACCRFQLRTDILSSVDLCAAKVYVEFDISPANVNPDVIDFLHVGLRSAESSYSSVSCAPDTGMVMRRRSLDEMPGKVEMSYITPLQTIGVESRRFTFEGFMGLYFCGGHLAFFRRHKSKAIYGDSEYGPWETSGFITDLNWVEGCRLTPCLAFGNDGAYDGHVVCISSSPPIAAERNTSAYLDASWILMAVVEQEEWETVV